MGYLKIGLSKVDITPPVGAPLIGHFEGGELVLSKGVHDELFCKAMVIDDGEDVAAIITNDLLYVDKDFVSSVRALIEKETGISGKNIMITATHTHTSPGAPSKLRIPFLQALGAAAQIETHLKNWEEMKPCYARKMASAAVMAFENRKEARMGASKGLLPRGVICTNRRDPSGPMDPDVGVLRVDDARGNPVGALVNYACHPTVNDPRENRVSGDFPAYAMRVIERIREGSIAMFSNGAEGDISTRWVRREQTFKEAERLGNILGCEALKVLEQIKTEDDVKLKVGSETVRLPYRELPSLNDAKEAVEKARSRLEELEKGGAPHGALRRAITNLQGARAILGLVRGGGFKKREEPTEVQVIAFNHTALVGVPGELFVQWGLDIKEKSRFKNTFIVGLANDYIPYVLMPEDYKETSYETYVSPWTPEAGFKIRDAALRLINRLKS